MNAKNTLRVFLTALLILSFSVGHAQQTTEKFIPIGMSPGVSGTSSYIGIIVSADTSTKSVSIQSDGETRMVTVAPATRIWLDRSKIKKPNLDGNFGALKAGIQVEVMHMPNDATNAKWIKIESL